MERLLREGTPGSRGGNGDGDGTGTGAQPLGAQDGSLRARNQDQVRKSFTEGQHFSTPRGDFSLLAANHGQSSIKNSSGSSQGVLWSEVKP